MGAKMGTTKGSAVKISTVDLKGNSFPSPASLPDSYSSITRRISWSNHHSNYFPRLIFLSAALLCASCQTIDIDNSKMTEDAGENLNSVSSLLPNVNSNLLVIIPMSKNRVYQRALGKSSIFTCSANVDYPERLNDFRWWWPDGRAIEATDSRVEIMTDQPGSLTLLFPAIQEEDLGTYRCTATYLNAQQLTTDFTLRAYVPITFEDAPLNQYAIKGHGYKIRCRVRADPEPQIDWKKDHRVISDIGHITVEKDGVQIRHASRDHEGIYTCRVRVTSMGTVEERHILLEVYESPILTSHPEKIEAVEGDNVAFACSASGRPPVEYDWINQKGEDVRQVSWERYMVDKYKGTLHINGITRDDAQSFTCRAKNAAGVISMQSTLSVVTKPTIVEFKNITTQINVDASLTCIAAGASRAPDIKFYQEGNREPYLPGNRLSKRIFVDQLKDENGTTVATLKIAEVHRFDAGLYSCTAYNKRAETTSWGLLTVQFPPSFLNTPMLEQWSWDENVLPVNLSCFAEAVPNATITWFIEGNPNEVAVDQNTPNVKMKQIGYQSRSILEIFPGDSSMYKTYKCLAVNKLGASEHRIRLRKARKPGPMLEAILHQKTSSSLAYKLVGPVEDGGLPVKSFQAQCKREGHSWFQSKLKKWPADRQIFVIDGLQPMQTYQVRFAAENVVGLGEWAIEKTEQTPRRSVPRSPTILNEVVGNYAITAYPDRFQLIWRLPPSNGEKIDSFEISYQPVRNLSEQRAGGGVQTVDGDTHGQAQVLKKFFSGQPRLILRNLAPDTFYRVKVVAKNQIGNSPSDSIIFKTAAIPGEPWTPIRSPVTSLAAYYCSCLSRALATVTLAHVGSVLSSSISIFFT